MKTINFNYISVFDFETGSRNAHKTQPTQLACVMIDPRKLIVVPNSEFNSEIRPILDDEEAIKQGFDIVEEDALKKTRKTREALATAPELKQVWESFTEYVSRFQTKQGNQWNAPVRGGFNIYNFDNVIIDRLCMKFGPWDKEWSSQGVFHPRDSVDLLNDFWRVTENLRLNNTNSISLDNIREWLGMPTEGSHDGLNDVLDCAELIIRFIKLHRKLYTGISCINCSTPNRVKFEGSLSSWKRPKL